MLTEGLQHNESLDSPRVHLEVILKETVIAANSEIFFVRKLCRHGRNASPPNAIQLWKARLVECIGKSTRLHEQPPPLPFDRLDRIGRIGGIERKWN